MPLQNNHHNSGQSLIEVMIVTALLPVLIFGAMDIFKTYIDSGQRAIKLGENEDARNYIRTNLDCKKTFIKEGSICKTGGYIRGYDQNNQPIASSATSGRDFDGTKVRTHCSNDGIALLIRSEIKRPGATEFEDLKGIPITCKICGVDVAALPATFPPPPIKAGPHRLAAFINTVATECGEATLPHDAIMHSYEAGTEKGKGKPFIVGKIAGPTLTKVCEMLGFGRVVSASCVENDNKDYRCNYTSPNNNYLAYWNGSSWQRKHGVSYHSWLSQITCDDPL